MTRPMGTVGPAAEPGVGDGADAVLLGRYELRERIGGGDAGPVWRAQDLLLRRDVAVRMLRTSADRDPVRARERAHHESRAAARFQHPSLAAIYDIADLDGDVVLVSEFLRGPSLERVLVAEGRLPAPLVARVGLHLARGLAVAHTHGVVHRDIEPGKVLLGVSEAGESDGTAALADLGITGLDTGTTGAAGTPFRAPEVAWGAPASPAGDLWALGATLHTALAGHPPVTGGAGPTAPGQAGPLVALIGALLAPDPAARPDADRARAALEAIVDALGSSSEHEPPSTRASATPVADGEALTAPRARVPADAVHPPTRAWTPRSERRVTAGRRRLLGAGVVGATGLVAVGAVGVVATSMSSPTSTGAAIVAAPEAPPTPPGPGPAVGAPITPLDPGPAITDVPLDGGPVLTAGTDDDTSDRERERDRDDSDRDDDREERDDRSERDRDGSDRGDSDRDESDRGRDRSDRDSDRGDSDRGDSDGGDSDGGDSDRDESSEGDD